jgi:hypothetical protein
VTVVISRLGWIARSLFAYLSILRVSEVECVDSLTRSHVFVDTCSTHILMHYPLILDITHHTMLKADAIALTVSGKKEKHHPRYFFTQRFLSS